MALDASALAEDIKAGVGAPEVTDEIDGMANAIVDHAKTGIVTFLPNTILGNAPPSGGSLTNGSGIGGAILLVPADLVARFVDVFGESTPQIIGMATAISAHLATGLVSFAAGEVTGTCSNTPVSPGALIGEASGGAISVISGSVLAPLIAAAVVSTEGTTSEIQGLSDAIVNHVVDNIEFTFQTGSITGSCSAGGGPIAGGAGVGGTIS